MPFADNPFASPSAPASGFRDAPPTVAPSPDGGFRDAPPTRASTATTGMGSPGDTSPLIEKYARQYGIDPRFVHAIMGIETGGLGTTAQTATSKAGARGYMQLMPETFRAMGVGDDITNPEQNIHAGVRYLAQQLHRYGGDWVKAAGAYNAGPGAIDAWLQTGQSDRALAPETKTYMARIAQARQQAGLDRPAEIARVEQGPRPPAAPQNHPAPTFAPHNVHYAGVNGEAVAKAADAAFKAGRWSAYEAVHEPLRALDAVLGAPQRFLTGMHNASTDPQYPLLARLAAGANVATHPFDEKLQGRNLEQTMHDLGADRLLKWVDGQVNKSADPQWAKDAQRGLAHLGVTFGAQLLTDPLSVFPIIKGARLAGGAAEVLRQTSLGAKAVAKVDGVFDRARTAVQTGGLAGIRQTAHAIFARRPELDVHLDPAGKAARLTLEAKHANAAAQEHQANRALVEQHLGDLTELERDDAGNYVLPEAIQQRLLQEPFVHGTPEMREQARAFGYRPTAAEEHTPPTGLFDYNVRDDYVPMLHPKKDTETAAFDLFKRQYAKDGPAAFERERKNNYQRAGNDIADVIQRRLALGTYWKERRMVDRESLQYFNAYGGFKKPALSDGSRPPVNEQEIAKLTHDPRTAQWIVGGRVIAGADTDFARSARQLSSQAIMTNPFPHGLRNVGMLSFLAGGPAAFGRGVAYAGGGLDAQQLARIQGLGLHADYVRDIEGPITKIPVAGKLLQGEVAIGQRVLNRLELGFRQSLLDHYDAVLGPSRTIAEEYQKADLVRRDLGDYRNVSAFVQALQAVGGPFVVFRIGTVPAAVGRALRKTPARVEAPARVEQDLNADPHRHGNTVLGGPVEDAARLGFAPIDFMMSPATLGPFGQVYREYQSEKEGYPESLADKAVELGRQYVPGLGLTQQVDQLYAGSGLPGSKAPEVQRFASAPYGAVPGVSPLHEALLSVFGAYEKKRPNEKYRNRIKRGIFNGPKNR